MNITLGNYQLTLSRTRAPSVAERLSVVTGLPTSQPFITATRDNVRQNISYIQETVSACMHARSEAVGRGEFHAYRIARSAHPRQPNEQLHAHEPLEQLLRTPNPLFDMSELLELSTQWLDATGNALWLKVRNADGRPVELWPVAAMQYIIERDDDGLPATYWFPETNVRVAAQDLIHVRRADIRTGPFDGHSILTDILETAKADTAIRLFQSRFFENDAAPHAIFSWPVGARVTQEQLDQLRQAWNARYQGPSNAGRLGFLTEGASIHLLSAGPKELDFAQSKRELRDAIREAFRVPRIVLGDVENVNLTNAETSYNVFLRDVVDRILAKHARALTRSLASDFGEGLVIQHASVIPENEEQFLARLHELKSCLTTNEQRVLLGHPALPAPVGTTMQSPPTLPE